MDLMRQLLYWSMVLAGGLSLFNVVRGRARWLALWAFVLIAAIRRCSAGTRCR